MRTVKMRQFNFNPRPRAEGGARNRYPDGHVNYFNPRPRAEGGSSVASREASGTVFQPTPSCRGRRFVNLA